MGILRFALFLALTAQQTHTSDGVPIRYTPNYSPAPCHRSSNYYYGYGQFYGHGGQGAPQQPALSQPLQPYVNTQQHHQGLPGYKARPNPRYRTPTLGRK